jgi:hypothetical protein
MSWCSDAPEDEAISLFAGLLANPDVSLNLVLAKWHETGVQVHLFRTPHQTEVSSTAAGSPRVSQSAKQASLLVTLLRVTVVRERTSQEIVDLHF